MKKSIAVVLAVLILVSGFGCLFLSSAQDGGETGHVYSDIIENDCPATGAATVYATGTDTDFATGTDSDAMGDSSTGFFLFDIMMEVFDSVLNFFSWIFSLLGL